MASVKVALKSALDSLTTVVSGKADSSAVAAKADANSVYSIVQTDQLLASQRPTSDASYPATGCGVSSVSGLTFRVSAGQAFIRGVLYSFVQADITLGAADGTNPRFDLIVADTVTSTFHAIAGTAAANPALPDIDPLTQLVLSQVLVPAAATTIPTILKTDLYHEATETTLTTSGSTIVSN